jgi:hypothetical protein
MEAQDKINPDHYKRGNIEAIEAIKESMTEEAYLGYLKGNILKYLWRWDSKHDTTQEQVTCIKKAGWYLAEMISHLEKTNVKEITFKESKS